MLHLKTSLLLCGLLAMLTCRAHAESTECPPDDDRNVIDDGGLCKDFQALRATIDNKTLVELVESHYQCNAKFRRAMCFYNSTRFIDALMQLERSGAFEMLLELLRDANVDTADIENVVGIFVCLELPVPKPDRNCDCKALRGHTFIGDLLDAMPRQQVHDYTAQAEMSNSNFGLFARTINSKQFQAQLEESLVRRELTRPLRVLRRHGWDIRELLQATQTILSW